jgi:hypothetical protein
MLARYKTHYPPELLDRITDILADLVLEDMERYARMQIIDTVKRPGNTSPPQG